MSADGDHQRTIEAVVEALRLKARDMDTEFHSWPGLFEAAAIVVAASNSDRNDRLWGSESSDEPSGLGWAERVLELDRCGEFSRWDNRCVLSHGDHHEDDLGRHHHDEAEVVFYHVKRQNVTIQDRWVTPLRDVTDTWDFNPRDFGIEWADVERVFGPRPRR